MGFFGGGGGTTPVNMVGASSGTAGTAGYVPAPAAGKTSRALFSDATFSEIPFCPQYKQNTASNYIAPSFVGAGAGNTSVNLRVRVFSPICIPYSGNIDSINFRVSTAPTIAFNVQLALWECGEDGLPSTYITGGTASTGTTSNTDLVISISPSVYIGRGWNFASLTSDTNWGAASFRGRTTSESSIQAWVWGGGSSVTFSGRNPSYTATSYSQTTHESSYSFVTTNGVAIGIKYA